MTILPKRAQALVNRLALRSPTRAAGRSWLGSSTLSLREHRRPFALTSSVCVHLAIVSLLAAVHVQTPGRKNAFRVEPLLLTAIQPLPPEPLETLVAPPAPLDGSPRLPDLDGSPAHAAQPLPSLAADAGSGAAPLTLPAPDALAASALPSPVPRAEAPGGGLPGPPQAARAQQITPVAGSPSSDVLIQRGLAWLVAHQWPDGSWHFEHAGGPCQGRCRHSGQEPSTTAATGLALLALLGGGQSPGAGPHQAAVQRGLAYLQRRMVRTSRGADLSEGTLYGHGIATLALCEAAGMTGDMQLAAEAQEAIRFIIAAQHPSGGWRYFPGQAGDTTVLGWQWMALRSGELAGLFVPADTWQRARHFLDSVAADGGAAYGYQQPARQPTPTAIGLACRLYGDWSRYDARMVQGAEWLAAAGPSMDDMYYNYYAAQVLHHSDSPHWPAFRQLLRDRLKASQAPGGHEAGSWYFPDVHTQPGGRLCDTALVLLILELEHRRLPLFGLRSTGP